MSTLTVVISAKNDEYCIRKCLEGVAWADEIIVVDAESTDRTAKIAREFTANVLVRADNPDEKPVIERARNFGIGKATKDWVLILDSDEVVTPELGQEIRLTLREEDKKYDGHCTGYYIRRKNIVLGKWLKYGGYWNYDDIKLFRRGMGIYPLIPQGHLLIDGKVGYLKNAVIHDAYRNMADWSRRINRYTTVDAEMRNTSSRGHIVTLPLLSFMRCYFVKGSYRDGLRGLIAAVQTAYYTFLKYVKIWEKEMAK